MVNIITDPFIQLSGNIFFIRYVNLSKHIKDFPNCKKYILLMKIQILDTFFFSSPKELASISAVIIQIRSDLTLAGPHYKPCAATGHTPICPVLAESQSQY